MDDQRVETGSALGLEYAGHGQIVAGVRPKAIDGFCREGDQRARGQQGGGAVDARLVRRSSSVLIILSGPMTPRFG
jgi:hypothetical protein